jgi:predicted phosphodiesterase
VFIWEWSDIHLEATRGWDLPFTDSRPRFNVLVVAGDLIPRMERGVRWLCERVTDRPVIYVAGNHEFYGCDVDRTVEKACEAAAGTNIHILQNDTVTIEGVLFVGATLWTDFGIFGDRDLAMMRAADGLNDYHRIRVRRYVERLRPAHTLARHLESRDFIQRATRQARADRIVVVTHHGCVPQAIKAGTENDILSAAYVSDCSDLLENVDIWIYGHTHESRDFMVGRTRIVSNSKGYGPWPPRVATWENPRFDPNFTIEI